jgi:hypothetical protein
VSGALSRQELAAHCERMRARLEEKRSELLGMDPRYAVWVNFQIDAMERRVKEIEAAVASMPADAL